MIEACHAPVARGTVFRADRFAEQAAAAKVLRFETGPELGQLLDRLQKQQS